jgi:hypothetical protein
VGRGKGDDRDETKAIILMLDVGSTLNQAALERPAPRAIRVVSYTEDYVVSSCCRDLVLRGLTK